MVCQAGRLGTSHDYSGQSTKVRRVFENLPVRTTELLDRLPAESDYVRTEIQEMAEQLETERRLIGDASAVALAKEMFLISGNRKRTFITVTLMICQQMTGVNAVVSYFKLLSV